MFAFVDQIEFKPFLSHFCPLKTEQQRTCGMNSMQHCFTETVESKGFANLGDGEYFK